MHEFKSSRIVLILFDEHEIKWSQWSEGDQHSTGWIIPTYSRISIARQPRLLFHMTFVVSVRSIFFWNERFLAVKLIKLHQVEKQATVKREQMTFKVKFQLDCTPRVFWRVCLPLLHFLVGLISPTLTQLQLELYLLVFLLLNQPTSVSLVVFQH